MHLKIDKKFNFLIYCLIILFLTSINNYNFHIKKIFNIDIIEVTGFSIKKNNIIKNQIKNLDGENIFFKKNILKNSLIEMIQRI